jgi:beta-lactamase regulating signal transducer with metallopeptidase domain
MNSIQFILVSSVCLSIFYTIYILIFKNETNFKQRRFYLLGSIIISLLMPLSSFRINIDFSKSQRYIETRSVSKSIEELNTSNSANSTFSDNGNNTNSNSNKLNWSGLFKKFYLIVSLVLFARIALQIIILIFQYFKSIKVESGNNIIIYNNQFKHTFSFFNWIFINTEFTSKDDIDQIISHEKIHASQYHSLDLILIELLAAVMWFNPLVWMMRNSIQLVHEYLADEGALSTGIDKLGYQALLINQVTEERLICLSSSFNHSLIKKRMIMMTKSKSNHKTKLKILALVPVAALLFLGVACINDHSKTNVVAAIAPTKMNVLYIGIDNPVEISVSEQKPEDLEVKIDNGTIQGSMGKYIVNPSKHGKAVITVYSKGNKVKETEFRVKFVPDPVAKIAGIKISGEINKADLLKQTEIYAEMENFDFDLGFEIVEFTVSGVIANFTVNEVSHNNKFTKKQKNLIEKLKNGEKVYIENIKAKGPDGNIRQLGSIALTIH